MLLWKKLWCGIIKKRCYMRTTMTKVLLPKNYNFNNFTLTVNHTNYRVYKVVHFFSSVVGAYVVLFYISKSNLPRFIKKYNSDFLIYR